MIIDKPIYYWIYVVPSHPEFPMACLGMPPSKEEYLEHFGKWAVMDDRDKLDELALKLDPYVECRAIYSIKYTRAPEEVFGLNTCVMCVFCDDRDREEIWEILARYGVTVKAFGYERQTIEMWQPGGLLVEAWIQAHGVDPNSKDADEIRKITKENFEKWLTCIDKRDPRTPWTFEMI